MVYRLLQPNPRLQLKLATDILVSKTQLSNPSSIFNLYFSLCGCLSSQMSRHLLSFHRPRQHSPKPAISKENQKIFGVWSRYYTSYDAVTQRCSSCGRIHGFSFFRGRSLFRDMLNGTLRQVCCGPREQRQHRSCTDTSLPPHCHGKPCSLEHAGYHHHCGHASYPPLVEVLDTGQGKERENNNSQIVHHSISKEKRDEPRRTSSAKLNMSHQQQQQRTEDSRLGAHQHPSNPDRHCHGKRSIRQHPPQPSHNPQFSPFRQRKSHPLVGFFMRRSKPRPRPRSWQDRVYHRWAEPNPDVCDSNATLSFDASVASSETSTGSSSSESDTSGSTPKRGVHR